MTHAHRWRLDEPDGHREVRGQCAGCGLVRMFRASSYGDNVDVNTPIIPGTTRLPKRQKPTLKGAWQ